MKFKDYMVKKSSPLSESSSYTKINEAGADDFGAIIKGIMAYSKAVLFMEPGKAEYSKTETLQVIGRTASNYE